MYHYAGFSQIRSQILTLGIVNPSLVNLPFFLLVELIDWRL